MMRDNFEGGSCPGPPWVGGLGDSGASAIKMLGYLISTTNVPFFC